MSIVTDSGEDEMVLIFGGDLKAGRLFMIASVMANPSVAENLVAEATIEVFAFVLKIVVGIFLAFGDLEGMRRGAESNDRATALEIFINVNHLLVRKIQKARENEHEVGLFKNLETLNVRSPGGNFALVVDSEKNGGFKAVIFSEDTGKGGAGFLGAVFVIGGNKDDVLSFSRARRSFIRDLSKGRNREKKS